MLSGRAFLELMHLSETALSIAGGVILFMMRDPHGVRTIPRAPSAAERGEPFIVPLAVPLIAGPLGVAT